MLAEGGAGQARCGRRGMEIEDLALGRVQTGDYTGGDLREDLLGAFESSPGKFRRFCTRCGSHLMAERVGRSTVMLRLGCLDTPVVGRSVGHIRRSDGASWFDPAAVLEEFPEDYPARGRLLSS